MNSGIPKARMKLFPWEAEIEPLYRRNEHISKDGTSSESYQIVELSEGIFRTDDGIQLGTVTPRYTNITNESIEQVIYEFEDAGCEYVKHGEWQGGKMVWCQLKSNELGEAYIGNSNVPDKVKGTILIASGHGGTLPFTVRATTIRVVCWNTFVAAMKSDAAINVRHKGEAQEKVYTYKEQVHGIGEAHKELVANFNRMKKAEVTWPKIEKFGFEMLGLDYDVDRDEDYQHGRTKKRIESMFDSYDDIAGLNAWGAFNMVTGYVDHAQNAKTDAGRDSYEFSYNSLLNSKIKQQAYSRMMAYTDKYEKSYEEAQDAV